MDDLGMLLALVICVLLVLWFWFYYHSNYFEPEIQLLTLKLEALTPSFLKEVESLWRTTAPSHPLSFGESFQLLRNPEREFLTLLKEGEVKLILLRREERLLALAVLFLKTLGDSNPGFLVQEAWQVKEFKVAPELRGEQIPYKFFTKAVYQLYFSCMSSFFLLPISGSSRTREGVLKLASFSGFEAVPNLGKFPYLLSTSDFLSLWQELSWLTPGRTWKPREGVRRIVLHTPGNSQISRVQLLELERGEPERTPPPLPEHPEFVFFLFSGEGEREGKKLQVQEARLAGVHGGSNILNIEPLTELLLLQYNLEDQDWNLIHTLEAWESFR